MPLNPVPFREFGGLDLSRDPLDVGPNRAIDMLDVELLANGGIRARDRLVSATAGLTLTDFHHMDQYDYQQIFYAPSIIGFRASGGNVIVNEFNVTSGGVYTATQRQSFAMAQKVSSSATIGTSATTTPSMYFALADAELLRKLTYNGAGTWTLATVGTGRPRWVTISPTDNRLVQARFTDPTWSPTGANGSISAVFFSDPGAPETYTSVNWVALRPGDGEEITALETWRESVVAFKETAMFVFYGASTLSSGIAQFNYRPVTLPGRIQSNVVVGTQGMYFCTSEGIWVTDGIRFTRVSGDIQGVFDLSLQDTDFRPATNLDGNAPYLGRPFRLAYARDRLYLNFDSEGSAWTTLVYDTVGDYWLRHDYRAVHVFDAPGQFSGLVGGPDIAINQGSIASQGFFYTEPGELATTLSPYWSSGWYDLGSNEFKSIKKTIVHVGHGTSYTYFLYNEDGQQVNDTQSIPASDYSDIYINKATRGRRFRHSIQGTNDFRCQGLTHYLRGAKIPGASVT